MHAIQQLLDAVADLPWYWMSKKRVALQHAARIAADEIALQAKALDLLHRELCEVRARAEEAIFEAKRERTFIQDRLRSTEHLARAVNSAREEWEKYERELRANYKENPDCYGTEFVEEEMELGRHWPMFKNLFTAIEEWEKGR
jgi:hypothetical protein